VVPQFLKDWTLPGGWPWKARFEHRAMLVPGDVVIMWGKVTGKQEKGGMGLIELEIGMKTQDGIESMPGTATVVLPLRNGPEIPYPFVPPAD
jgi:acyl dehydratase